MTSEVSNESEIRVIVTKITSNAVYDLKSFFQSCLIDDFCELSEIRDELKSDFKIFLGITKKNVSAGRVKWKACCIREKNEKYHVHPSAHIDGGDHDHQDIDSAFNEFCVVMKKFYAEFDDDGCYSVIDTLKAIEMFSHAELDEMMKFMIGVGLDENFLTKYAAGKFLAILKDFLEVGNEIKVNESQLENLIRILASENFAYDEGNVQLEALKILKFLKLNQFAEFSQESLENIQKFLNDNRNAYSDAINLCQVSDDKSERAMLGHLSQCRVDFLTSIAIFGGKIYAEDFFEVLTIKNSKSLLKQKEEEQEKIYQKIMEIKSDPRSKRSELIESSCEFNELQKEINELKEIERAKSEVKIEEFLIEVGKVFQKDSKGVFGYLKEKATKAVEVIQEKLQSGEEKVSKDGKSEEEKVAKDRKKQNVENKACQEDTEVVSKDDPKNPTKIDQMKVIYSDFKAKGQNFLDAFKAEVPPFIVELLYYAKNYKLSQCEARSILSILMKFEFPSIDEVPKNIFKAFGNQENDDGYESNLSDDESSLDDKNFDAAEIFNVRNEIFEFGLRNKLKNPQNFIEFVTQVSTEDDFGDKTFKALDEYKSLLTANAQSMRKLLKHIDKKKASIALGIMINRTTNNQKLPIQAFKFMESHPDDNRTFEVLKKVLNADMQTIPNNLVAVVTKKMNESKVEITPNKIEVANFFVLRRLVKIQDLEKFCLKALKANTDAALKIIYDAIQTDQKVPDEILKAVGGHKTSKSNQDLINFITESETKLSKVMSGTTKLEEKFKIFEEIESEPRSWQNNECIKTLTRLVLYDESVAKRAFEVLVKIFAKNFALSHEELCKLVLFAMRSNVKLETVEEFLNIFKLNRETLLQKCEDEGLRSMLQEAFENASFIELSEENLQFILSLNRRLAEEEILLLLTAMENKKYKESFVPIIEVLRKNELGVKTHKQIKFVLINDRIHLMAEELLSLLPSNVRKRFKESINEPENFIEKTLNDLSNNVLSVNILQELTPQHLLQNFTDDHVEALKDICRKICENINSNKAGIKSNGEMEEDANILQETNEIHVSSLLIISKILQNLSFEDEEISNLLLNQACMMLNIQDKNVKNSSEILKLAIALLHLIYFKHPLNENVFIDFPSSTWSSQILIQILLPFGNNYDEFDLHHFAETLRKAERDKNELLTLIIEKGAKCSIEEVIDLIIILESNEQFYEKYLSIDDYAPIPLRLHESWLKWILLEKCVGKDLKDFKILMKYRPSLIQKLLNADDKNQLKVENFIKIFKSLQFLTNHKEKRNQLLKLCSRENTTWLPSIELYLIENLAQSALKRFEKFKGEEHRKRIKKEVNKLNHLLQRIYHTGWSVNAINSIIAKIENEDDIIKTTSALRTLFEYEIDELHSNARGEKALEVITRKCEYSEIYKSLHEIVIHNTFGGARKQSIQDLCDEIIKNNPELKLQLIEEYKEVLKAYRSKSNVLRRESSIKDWSQSDIESWTQIVKICNKSSQDGVKNIFILPTKTVYEKAKALFEGASYEKPSMYETIAVLMRAIKIFKGYEPREIQILSVLILLNPDEGKGRLAQINTGEGKTTIVAMLAVFKALEGKSVDVITSSPELAKPQVKELKEFYKMFGLTVAHNGNDPVDKSIRYKSDIIYGAASDFQGDILRDEYSKMGTRSGRQCDFAIVDEVDSMLIDGRKHIVMLSSSMPGMNYLEHFYAIIWSQIKIFAQAVREKDGTYFYVESDVIDSEGNINENPEESWIPLKGTKESFIKDKLIEHLKEELQKGKDSSVMIPNHLQELIIKYQLDQWIGCAIYGRYHSKNNQNYILDKGKVVPVDSDNTGVLQDSMNWSNGLHQFLQIKHGAKITPESLTTNYISNVAFFKRYGKNLFGLTGTLGSKKAKEVLEKTYNVDSVIIPPFMVKRFKELSAIIENNENDWYEEIVESNMNHLRNERAVLIITRYISEARELHKRFSEKFKAVKWDTNKIRQYKTDQESKAVEEAVGSGDLIIATNIAGRGTDIKTSENVEANGGLHVCVISLPSNERVEQQNVGRTSRTGHLGTSQFIIYHKHHSDLNFMKSFRDELEDQELSQAEQEMKKTLVKDEVFKKFCELLENVPKNTTRAAVEDRFGVWLQLHGETSENLVAEFENFKNDFKKDSSQGEIIKNPIFHIKLGNELMENKKYRDAIVEYTKAIELESEFCEIAHYNRGYARLALSYKTDVESYFKDFKTAREKIRNRETELNIIQAAKEDDAKVLSEQVSHKLMLYGMQKNAIDQAIGLDEDEHNEIMEEFYKEKKILEKNIEEEKLQEVQEKFSKMENYDEKLKELKEQKESNQEIESILNSPEYKEFITLKERLKPLENLMQLQSQIDSREEFFKNGKVGVINQAINENLDMKIEIKKITESLPKDEDVELYKEEIEEFQANGMLGAFEVSKRPPIDWYSVGAVFFLGMGQVIGGAMLCVFTVGTGAAIGSTMLMEGISDVITAVKDGIINRSFSWVQYGIQKAISYITSILCMGMKALKDAGKTVAAEAKNLFKPLVEVTKDGWKCVAYKIGLEVGKKVGTEVAKEVINFGIDKAVLPLVNEGISSFVTPKIIEHLENNEIVQRWLIADKENRNARYQGIILEIAQNIIQQEQQNKTFIGIAKAISEQVERLGVNGNVGKIGGEVTSGVISQKCQTINSINRTVTSLMDLNDIIMFRAKFLMKFEDAIEEKNKEIGEEKQNTFGKRVQAQKEQQITNQTSDKTVQLSSHQGSNFDEFMNAGKNDETLIDKSQEQVQQQIICDPKKFYTKVSDLVSKQITQKINGSFIAPYASQLATKSINFATASLNAKLNLRIQSVKSRNKIKVRESNGKDTRLDDEKNKPPSEEALKGTEKEIEAVEKNGKVGRQHLGSVCKANDVQIILYDDKGNIKDIIGEGTPVEILYKDGHYMLPDGSDPLNQSGDKNNCLFDVIAHKTGKDSAQMRANTVEVMKNDKVALAYQYEDVQFLKAYDPEMIHEGGCRNIKRQSVQDYVNAMDKNDKSKDYESNDEVNSSDDENIYDTDYENEENNNENEQNEEENNEKDQNTNDDDNKKICHKVQPYGVKVREAQKLQSEKGVRRKGKMEFDKVPSYATVKLAKQEEFAKLSPEEREKAEKKLKRDLLCHPVDSKDHKKCLSSGSSNIAKEYRAAQAEEIKKDPKEGFASIIIRNAIDTHSVTVNGGNADYKDTLPQFADEYENMGFINKSGAEAIRNTTTNLPDKPFSSDDLERLGIYKFDPENKADQILKETVNERYKQSMKREQNDEESSKRVKKEEYKREE